MFSKDNDSAGSETIIGPSIKVKGGLVGGGNIIVGGKVEGSISTQHNVLVGEKAEIMANVKAANAQVAGFVKGNVAVTGKLELMPTSKIMGNIVAKILVVAEGAQLNGSCQMGVLEKGEAPNPSPVAKVNKKSSSN
ncbi:MAG: polymer-forming cytoskeletal protein [Patescibacteria group bacterium]